MRTDCDDCPTTDLCRHPDEPCAKRSDAERARERAAEAPAQPAQDTGAAPAVPIAFRLVSPSATNTLLTEDAALAADMLQRGWEVTPLGPVEWGAPDCRSTR